MDENTALRKERNFARGLCAAFMLAIWILIGILLIGCQPSDEEPTYPQRAYACKLAHNEPDSVLKRYDVVYGYQEINHIADAKARLGSKPDFFATLHPTCTKETEPAEWEYWNAAHNFTEAMHVAAYENLKRGCDWFLRDASGNTLPMWTPDNQWKMLNLTEHCPPGVWEKTAGLTALDYLVGPMLDMITSEKSKSAYAGYVLEDGPDKHFWNYVWDTMGVSCVQLSATCRSKPGYFAAADSCVQRYLDDFVLAAGRRGMLMLTNGHHVLESCPSYDPAKWGAFSGCKLERFGDWGGCPKRQRDSMVGSLQSRRGTLWTHPYHRSGQPTSRLGRVTLSDRSTRHRDSGTDATYALYGGTVLHGRCGLQRLRVPRPPRRRTRLDPARVRHPAWRSMRAV